jgi:beta-lactamase superfamily II metal-dependent hydrolase
MMKSPRFIILDVGHGNCAVLLDSNGATVFDCAPGPTLIELLYSLRVSEIASVVISHADADHIGGLIHLLNNTNIKVQQVFLNSDAAKGSQTWQALKASLEDARTRTRLNVRVGLTTERDGSIDTENVRVEILAPSPGLALCNVGDNDFKGRRLTSNSMSAVLKLVYNSNPIALITGDIDDVGLQNLLEETDKLEARILVFPHHGGIPGSANPRQFASRLCDLVKPDLIVFSIGRGAYGTPQPEIIEGVRTAVPKAHILCTQLSQRCAATLPAATRHHLVNLPSRGKLRNTCCGGTVFVEMDVSGISYLPLDGHRLFVINEVNDGLCRK